MQKFLLKTVFLMLLLISSVYASADCMKVEDRIYLQEEQVIVSSDAILVMLGNEIFEAPSLSTDTNGLYISIKDRECRASRCPNGHPIFCRWCGGCCENTCEYGCLCSYRLK